MHTKHSSVAGTFTATRHWHTQPRTGAIMASPLIKKAQCLHHNSNQYRQAVNIKPPPPRLRRCLQDAWNNPTPTGWTWRTLAWTGGRTVGTASLRQGHQGRQRCTPCCLPVDTTTNGHVTKKKKEKKKKKRAEIFTKLSSCRHNDNDNVSNGQIHTPRCLPVDTTTSHNVINGQIIIHSMLFSCRHNHKS